MHWPAVATVMRLYTQWHRGLDGRISGLRYEALPIVLRAQRLPPAQWPDIISDVQTIERELVRLAQELPA